MIRPSSVLAVLAATLTPAAVAAEPGGFGVYRWSGSNWNKVPGAAVQISVAPAGQAWIVNDSHQIFSWAG